MNYIGSKTKLCKEFIPKTIKSVCGDDLSKMVLCDIFAGTGTVGRTFKTSVREVISNDIEFYSYVLNKAYIENNEPLEKAISLVETLNSMPITNDGFIYKNYCLGGGRGRNYFSDANAMKIDTIRAEIEALKFRGEITESEYFFLLCSLLESSDKVANVASVYCAYLKRLKKSAEKEMILKPVTFELNDGRNKVFNKDANLLINEISGDILYLDPPYNSRQYGAYYHILNTIAKYKPFEPSGKSGLCEYVRSKYCSFSTVLTEFEELIKNANFKYVFLSYNNEGLMSIDAIKRIMEKYGRYDLAKTTYQRFKADSNRNNKASTTVEYLHILEKS